MDRGVIAVSEKIKKNVKPREFENSTDSDFYKALDQGTITNNSIVSQRSLVSDEQSAVVFNDIKDQTQTAGPLEVGRGYGMQTGHFIRNAGATVLTELAQGSGVISALGSATETLTATHNTNQEVFQEQMGTLQDQNVEAKESLEESIVARKQEAVVDSWKFFSFGSFSGKY